MAKITFIKREDNVGNIRHKLISTKHHKISLSLSCFAVFLSLISILIHFLGAK